MLNKSLPFLFIIVLLAACTSSPLPIAPAPTLSPPQPASPALPPIASASAADLTDQRDYLTDLDLDVSAAAYYPLIAETLTLTPAEIELLNTNGFVVSDRQNWQRFHEAYAWIYWKDLPVLITSDSILHTMHQSYLNLLKRLEYEILIPEMHSFLKYSKLAVQEAQQTATDPSLDHLYADVETFIAVGQALLDGQSTGGETGKYVKLAQQANSYSQIELFNTEYLVDFTLFKPRGHYAETETLQRYFRAMNWLAQIDFRFVEYDMETNEPTVNHEAIAAALILQDAIDDAGQHARWDSINGILEILVGRSDNMTLTDLDRFRADMQLNIPFAALQPSPTAILDQLAAVDYGRQRITGQIIERHIDNDSSDSIPRPVSFMLMGQRFALDSFVLGNVVYDRMMKEGQPIERHHHPRRCRLAG